MAGLNDPQARFEEVLRRMEQYEDLPDSNAELHAEFERRRRVSIWEKNRS